MVNLIISADDFGYSPVFNETMLELASQGYLSAISIMIKSVDDQIQSRQARTLIDLRKKQNISLGLHLMFDRNNQEDTIQDQWDRFITFFGFQPDFLDLHKPDSYPAEVERVTEYCRAHYIPCRNYGQVLTGVRTTDKEVLAGTINFGPIMDFTDIIDWMKSLTPDKYYEIQFHPGKFDPQTRSSINIARELDAENIIRLNGMLLDYDVRLISFKDIPPVR